jgi:RimJ/RimL family protein N-acetyltransferase
MNTKLFEGELVRLTAVDPEKDADDIARWSHDSHYLRLRKSPPARPATPKQMQARLEKNYLGDDHFLFELRTLADNRHIGFVNLPLVFWRDGDAFIAIGLGEPEARGQGYGTDALRVLVRYAFHELNLHRVSLRVLADNARAIRAYEKAGFVTEGRERAADARDGQRTDILWMGLLREDWEKSVRSQQSHVEGQA